MDGGAIITQDPVGVDFITLGDGGWSGRGDVATRLLQGGFGINSLRTLDVLRKEEWKQFDAAVVATARDRLVGVGDLVSRGLTFPIQNALGTTQLEWEVVSHMEGADVSMSGVTEGERDRVIYSLKSLPLPIIHKGFSVNIRALEASRRLGQTLDTTMAEQASRLVSEKIEDILYNGHTIVVGGQSIPGYTTHANRNTGSLLSNWADSVNTTGEEIVQDVLQMIADAYADKMFGPYVMYVPIDYFIRLGDDYKAGSDKTIMSRLLEIPGISAIRQSASLSGGASGEVLLVQMTRDVVDMVDGFGPTMVQWESHGGMQFHFKVMAIMIPRIKATALNQSGIVHHSV
jgi:uncharacterized linocin/CFP29 family protein